MGSAWFLWVSVARDWVCDRWLILMVEPGVCLFKFRRSCRIQISNEPTNLHSGFTLFLVGLDVAAFLNCVFANLYFSDLAVHIDNKIISRSRFSLLICFGVVAVSSLCCRASVPLFSSTADIMAVGQLFHVTLWLSSSRLPRLFSTAALLSFLLRFSGNCAAFFFRLYLGQHFRSPCLFFIFGRSLLSSWAMRNWHFSWRCLRFENIGWCLKVRCSLTERITGFLFFELMAEKWGAVDFVC